MSTGTLNGKAIVPSLTVDDIGKSIAFYEALGFVVSDRWEENGTLTSAMVQSGAINIGLNQDDWKKGRDRQKHYDPCITGPILAVAAAVVTALWGPQTLARYSHA